MTSSPSTTPLSHSQKPRWSTLIHLIGNLIDHYDTALYGFMVPVLGPLFFPTHDPIGQWIMGYGLMCASWVTRPLGSFLWGRWAERFSTLHALAYALLGMACATVGLGCIPTYHQVGWAAPLLLMCFKALQSFCTAGESTLAPLTILDYTQPSRKSPVTGFFHSSTVWGCMAASAASTWVLSQPDPAHSWRYPFWLGGVLALVGMALRFQLKTTAVQYKPQNMLTQTSLWVQRRFLGCLAFISTITWVTYSVPFVLLNTLVPQMCPSITLAEMMQWNTGLLMMDALFLPLIGRWLKTTEPVPMMRRVIMILGTVLVIGLFVLPACSMVGVVFFRMLIIVLGLIYTVVLYLWLHQQATIRGYALLGLGNNLGTEILGRSIPWMGLLLFKYTSAPWVIGLYLACLCGCAWFSLREKRHK